MDAVHPICAGIDVHQEMLMVCLRTVGEDGQVTKQVERFGTMYRALIALGEWLRERGCSVVAMESTGVHWKPVYHVWVGMLDEVIVGNSYDMRRRPGKKTDKADAEWISE